MGEVEADFRPVAELEAVGPKVPLSPPRNNPTKQSKAQMGIRPPAASSLQARVEIELEPHELRAR